MTSGGDIDVETGRAILYYLKFSALGLAAVSGVWAVISKFTFEDDSGVKRLTPSGIVALGLMGVSLIVSATSHGLETLVASQEGKIASDKEAATRLRNEQKAAMDEARSAYMKAQADYTSAKVGLLASMAESQRLLTLALASEERERQVLLARDLNLGSSRNLAKTSQALNDIGRLLQPLDRIWVSLQWDVKGPLTRSETLQGVINDAVAAAKIEDDGSFRLSPQYIVSHDANKKVLAIGGSGVSPAVPRSTTDPDLFQIANVRARIAIFRKENAPLVLDALRVGDGDAIRDGARNADLVFSAMGNARVVSHVMNSGNMEIIFDDSPAPDTLLKSGNVVSIQDLEQSLLLVIPDAVSGSKWAARLFLQHVSFRVSGRQYGFNYVADYPALQRFEHIERFIMQDGSPMFVVKRMRIPDD